MSSLAVVNASRPIRVRVRVRVRIRIRIRIRIRVRVRVRVSRQCLSDLSAFHRRLPGFF